MVFHPACEGFECDVRVGGATLQEHEASNDKIEPEIASHQQSITITRFIESTTDQAFSVRISVKPPYVLDCQDLWFCVLIDGEQVDSPVLTRQEHTILPEWEESVTGVTVGNVLKPFLFSKISITSDDVPAEETKNLKERLASVGDIVVKVYRQGDGGRADFDEEIVFRQPDYTDVNELAMKTKIEFVSHGTSLGEATTTQSAARWVATCLDGLDKPIAIFCFKYRSYETLQKLVKQAPKTIDLTGDDGEAEEQPSPTDEVCKPEEDEVVRDGRDYKLPRSSPKSFRGSEGPSTYSTPEVVYGDAGISSARNDDLLAVGPLNEQPIADLVSQRPIVDCHCPDSSPDGRATTATPESHSTNENKELDMAKPSEVEGVVSRVASLMWGFVSNQNQPVADQQSMASGAPDSPKPTDASASNDTEYIKSAITTAASVAQKQLVEEQRKLEDLIASKDPNPEDVELQRDVVEIIRTRMIKKSTKGKQAAGFNGTIKLEHSSGSTEEGADGEAGPDGWSKPKVQDQDQSDVQPKTKDELRDDSFTHGIKREHDDGNAQPPRKRKRRVAKPKMIGKVMIDLTGIDDEEDKIQNAQVIDSD